MAETNNFWSITNGLTASTLEALKNGADSLINSAVGFIKETTTNITSAVYANGMGGDASVLTVFENETPQASANSVSAISDVALKQAIAPGLANAMFASMTATDPAASLQPLTTPIDIAQNRVQENSGFSRSLADIS